MNSLLHPLFRDSLMSYLHIVGAGWMLSRQRMRSGLIGLGECGCVGLSESLTLQGKSTETTAYLITIGVHVTFGD